MSKLIWDAVGAKKYENGVDHGVFYPYANSVYGEGVAWNGLTAVNETPSGGEANDIYADNIKYASCVLPKPSVQRSRLTLIPTSSLSATVPPSSPPAF